MVLTDPTYPLFPVFSFLGFILALTPLSWHLQAWNAGTCLYMLWAGLGSLNMFVNAVVWDGRIDNIAPVWCDISTKFFIGAGVGIPAASLCIVRRLYLLSSIRSVNMTKQDKKRAVIADLAIGLGIPLLIMILHYIVQGHRFDILQDIGCQPATYNTLPAYFLLFMWPPLLGCISFVYAALSLRNFFIRRIQFSQFATSAQAMNASRYLRLMLLACCEICCTIPIGIYSIYIDNKGVPIAPWVSWSDTHYNFSRVGQVPALIWMNDPSYYTSVQLSRWIFPVCCIIFFALFGFAEEARRHYSMLFWWIAKRFGLKPPAKKLQATLPTSFVRPKPPIMSSGPPPMYSPSSPDFKKKGGMSFTSSFATTDVDSPGYNVEKSHGLSTPTLPEPAKIKDATTFHSSSSLPPSPATSECPTINHLPFETDPNHHISISEAYVASRPTSPEYDRPAVPAFHRPFSPPSVCPVAMPHPSSPSDEMMTAPRQQDSDVIHIV